MAMRRNAGSQAQGLAPDHLHTAAPPPSNTADAVSVQRQADGPRRLA
jgi:hypothetical protein